MYRMNVKHFRGLIQEELVGTIVLQAQEDILGSVS